MLFAMPLFIGEMLFFDEVRFIDVNWLNTLSLIYQGVLVVALGYIIWTKLYQRYSPVSLHSFVFLIPVSGVFLGGLVLGEPMTVKIIAALVLIVSGILIVQMRKTGTAALKRSAAAGLTGKKP